MVLRKFCPRSSSPWENGGVADVFELSAKRPVLLTHEVSGSFADNVKTSVKLLNTCHQSRQRSRPSLVDSGAAQARVVTVLYGKSQNIIEMVNF